MKINYLLLFIFFTSCSAHWHATKSKKHLEKAIAKAPKIYNYTTVDNLGVDKVVKIDYAGQPVLVDFSTLKSKSQEKREEKTKRQKQRQKSREKKTETRQKGKTQRTKERKKGKTEKIKAKQDGRTNRTQIRQKHKTERRKSGIWFLIVFLIGFGLGGLIIWKIKRK